MRFAVAITFLLCSSCAYLDRVSPPCGIEPPPPSYMERVPIRETVWAPMSREEVGVECNREGSYGCRQTTNDGKFRLVYADDVGKECVRRIMEHEFFGHANGLYHGPNDRGWFTISGVEITK